MKVIDILNKMANGTLEDGFKFCFKNEVYTYTNNSIRDDYNNRIGQKRVIENYLNEEVLLFKENNAEVIEEKKEIKRLDENDFYDFNHICLKINELVRAVNKLIKESEEK